MRIPTICHRKIIVRFAAVSVALLLGALSACGRGNVSPARDGNALKLIVLPESFIPGGSAKLRLEVDTASDPVRVDVVADDASSLKALYFDLVYDPAQSHPVSAQGSGLLADTPAQAGPNEKLQIAVLSDPGTVHFGQVLPRWQERSGFSGSGVLASVFIARGAEREPASVPLDSDSRGQLSYDAVAQDLEWHYASRGDYDQNSEVNISDLTPLGAHFGETSASPPSPFPYTSGLSVIDGDGNGEINISDITPIGASFGNLVQSYHIYSSLSAADYPAGPSDPNGAGASLLATVDFTSSASLPTDRRLYVFNVAAPNPLDNYWARPFDGVSEGIASTMASGSGVVNTPPTASFTALPVSGAAPLNVNFDASGSSDPDGTIIKYEWDFDGDSLYEVDNGAVATASHVFTVDGSYNVHLRVTDNGGAPGGSSTTITVGSAGNMPPTASWLVTPTSGPAPLSVTFDPSASSDPDGTIVLYEYDNDGDGVFDGATATPTIAGWSYTTPGMYLAELRVTDNLGATASAFQMIQVSVAGPSWHIVQAVTTAGEEGRANSLAVIGGTPAQAWIDETNHYAMYHRFSDPLATSGTVWRVAGTSTTAGLPVPSSGLSIALLEVAGLPAVFYMDNGQLTYIPALDLDGVAWGVPITLDGLAGQQVGLDISAAIINSNPAVSYYDATAGVIKFFRADSVDGSSWLDPLVGFGLPGRNTSLADIGGNPGIAFQDPTDNHIYFAWSSTANGTAGTWNFPAPTTEVPTSSAPLSLAEISGLPAIVYYNSDLAASRYVRATDGTYNVWSAPLETAPTVAGVNHGNYPSMVESPLGVPAVSMWFEADCALGFAIGLDSTGTSWASGNPDAPVAPECVGGYTHMVYVGSNPVISYYDLNNAALKLAIFY